MAKTLDKPFIRHENYSYDGYYMSENFFVVESDEQLKAVLRSKSPDEFKDWLQNVRNESKNNDPIGIMVYYWYFVDGMDKPYKNDITDLFINDLPNENTNYVENLYNLLVEYNRETKWRWCGAINKLKDSSLGAEWKEKFSALCGARGGARSRTRRNTKSRKNRRNGKSRKNRI